MTQSLVVLESMKSRGNPIYNFNKDDNKHTKRSLKIQLNIQRNVLIDVEWQTSLQLVNRILLTEIKLFILVKFYEEIKSLASSRQI